MLLDEGALLDDGFELEELRLESLPDDSELLEERLELEGGVLLDERLELELTLSEELESLLDEDTVLDD